MYILTKIYEIYIILFILLCIFTDILYLNIHKYFLYDLLQGNQPLIFENFMLVW